MCHANYCTLSSTKKTMTSRGHQQLKSTHHLTKPVCSGELRWCTTFIKQTFYWQLTLLCGSLEFFILIGQSCVLKHLTEFPGYLHWIGETKKFSSFIHYMCTRDCGRQCNHFNLKAQTSVIQAMHQYRAFSGIQQSCRVWSTLKSTSVPW